jgi:lipopolysaccharide/colanic/teichoic acid biosynthesis glycosyltransferase
MNKDSLLLYKSFAHEDEINEIVDLDILIRNFKRLTDIVISVLVLLICAPVLILAALAIKLETKGPALFIQERTGLKGKSFKMLKFRGMIDNAILYGPELTQVNDPRITKVGKFLRRTSIDEIPNFINVLMGDMSIIGPRPEIVSITKKYNVIQRKVFQFKPGITGYTQTNGRQRLTPAERVRMEIEYYENESFWGDLQILFNTVRVVISNQDNT